MISALAHTKTVGNISRDLLKVVTFIDIHEVSMLLLNGMYMSGVNEDSWEWLKKLGLETESEHVTYQWFLVCVILELCKNGSPTDFQSIYEGTIKKREHKVSKTWIHRILKSLVENRLIRVIDPDASRKRYIADVDSITAGLEQLKLKRLAQIDVRIRQLESERREIERINPYTLAQHIVSKYTGSDQFSSSLFATGVEEVHKLIVYTMTDIARPGDVIRATVVHMRPFERGVYERTKDFINAARRGVCIRYLAAGNLFREDRELADRISNQEMGMLLREIFTLIRDGYPFEIRIAREIITYNHICINDQRLILMVNEDPLTAALVTRNINSDLIDNVIVNFDHLWSHAMPLHQLAPEDLAGLGIDTTSKLSKSILSEKRVITDGKQQE